MKDGFDSKCTKGVRFRRVQILDGLARKAVLLTTIVFQAQQSISSVCVCSDNNFWTKLLMTSIIGVISSPAAEDGHGTIVHWFDCSTQHVDFTALQGGIVYSDIIGDTVSAQVNGDWPSFQISHVLQDTSLKFPNGILISPWNASKTKRILRDKTFYVLCLDRGLYRHYRH